MKIEKPISKIDEKYYSEYFDTISDMVYTIRLLKNNKELCIHIINIIGNKYEASSLIYECVVNSIIDDEVMNTLKYLMLNSSSTSESIKEADEIVNTLKYCIKR